jgi:predicted transcriptional regulator
MTAAKSAAATKKTPAAKKTASKPAATRKPAAKTRESKTSKRKIAAVDRALQAFQLRKLGYSFDEVGGVLGISRQAAHQLVNKYLDEAIAEVKDEAEGARQLQLSRLDHLFCKMLPVAEAGDSKAANTCRQIVMDQSKLQGLITDKQEVEANVVTGVFAVPLEAPATDDWTAKALEMSAGEEAAAEQLLNPAKPTKQGAQ